MELSFGSVMVFPVYLKNGIPENDSGSFFMISDRRLCSSEFEAHMIF